MKKNFPNKSKIYVKMWQDILLSPTKAKEALVDMLVPAGPNGELKKVLTVTLQSGTEIPVSEVSEAQAHAFMSLLCPKWARN